MFFKTTKAFVTSPIPCVTSMLVLHPRISTARTGPLGELVGVTLGVSTGVEGVSVALATPMITGVAVKIEGVLVGGRKGVGGLNGPGWITQPLQDVKSSISRITGMVFFILFSCLSLYPA